MDSSRWQKVQALFHEAASVPASGRGAFLTAQSGGDAELAADVLALLEEDGRGDSLLDRNIAHVADQILNTNSSAASFEAKDFGPYRAVRMLGYAADTLRGTALTPGRTGRRSAVPPTLLLGLLFIAGLVTVAWGTWDAVRAPELGVNYVQVAWSLLLVAWSISQYIQSGARMTGLIVISSGLAGEAVYIWNAVQAPGDWVNYFVAAWLFLLYLAWWLIRQWVRTGGHNAGRVGQVTAS